MYALLTRSPPLAACRIAQIQKTIDATGGRIGAAVHGGRGGGGCAASVNDSVSDDDTRGSGGGNASGGAARVHDPTCRTKELVGDEGSWKASVSPRTSTLLSKADQELHQTSLWRQQAASINLTPTQSAAARVQKRIGTDNTVDQEDSETTSTPPRGAASVVADTLCVRDGEAAGDSKDPGSVRAVTPERLRQSLARTKMVLQERVRERFEKHMEVSVASDEDNETGHAPPSAAPRTSQTSRGDAAAESTATTKFLSSPFYHSDGSEEHGGKGATSEEREEGQNEEDADEEEEEKAVDTNFEATAAEEETAEMADARLDREILALHEDLDRETALRSNGGDDDWQKDGHDTEEKSGSATGAGSMGSAAGSAAGSADDVAAGVGFLVLTPQNSQEDASGTTGRIGALSRGRSRSQSGAAGGGPAYNSVAVSPIHAGGYAMESSHSELSCEMEHSSDEDSSDEIGG